MAVRKSKALIVKVINLIQRGHFKQESLDIIYGSRPNRKDLFIKLPCGHCLLGDHIYRVSPWDLMVSILFFEVKLGNKDLIF